MPVSIRSILAGVILVLAEHAYAQGPNPLDAVRSDRWADAQVAAALERRRQEAIATDPDDAAVLAQCAPPPTLGTAMLRCAEAIANAGRTAEANDLARQAWVNAIDTANAEAAFLPRWPGIASADDQWARFQRLAWLADPTAGEGAAAGGPCGRSRGTAGAHGGR